MVSLNTRILFSNLTRGYQKEHSSFSKIEIVNKINEIKYLSAQKNVPRLTLRKEVLHLENKLAEVLELEKSQKENQKRESTKVQLLKKQITQLRSKLATCQDKEMEKKVERLSHLLGDFLAKKGSKEEIELSSKVLGELKIKDGARLKSLMADNTEKEKVKALKFKLEEIKDKLALQPNPGLQQKADWIEDNLKKYALNYPELFEEKIYTGEVKHTLIFGPPPPAEMKEEDDAELEKELPLPPPPKRFV